MTVVQLLPMLNGGGVERGTIEVANALQQNGHRSIVISAGGQWLPQLLATGSEHINWPIGEKSIFTLRLVSRLKKWLLKHPIDILHARSRLPAWIAWLAWRQLPLANRPRFITTNHGFHSVNRYSAIMGYGEKVIAVSNAIKDYLLQSYPLLEQNIAVIHRGIDSSEFPYRYQPSSAWKITWEAQQPETQGQYILTLPGRLTRLKGHADFIQLIARLAEKHPKVHGLIIGDSDQKHRAYQQEMRGMAEKLAPGRISFLGQRQDMKEIYAVSDTVLSLSIRPESFGRTVAEALYLGTPVIGYDTGGVGEILGKIYPYGLIKPYDNESLFHKACHGIAHGAPDVPEQDTYPQRHMLDKTLQLYQSMVNKES